MTVRANPPPHAMPSKRKKKDAGAETTETGFNLPFSLYLSFADIAGVCIKPCGIDGQLLPGAADFPNVGPCGVMCESGAFVPACADSHSAAVAMALADPTLSGHEQFGMKLNWGGFDGANAVGLTTLGVLGKNLFATGDRLTVSGGVGWGQASVTGYTQSVAGGHAGLQLTW